MQLNSLDLFLNFFSKKCIEDGKDKYIHWVLDVKKGLEWFPLYFNCDGFQNPTGLCMNALHSYGCCIDPR